MASPYTPNVDPYERMAQSVPRIGIPMTCSVVISIGNVEGGFVLCVNAQGEQLGHPRLCFGAEAIEQGVQAVITHLVTQGLEK
jgi:hypothetical protein